MPKPTHARTRDPAELAKALGVSVRTVRAWRGQGMPRERGGAWDVDRVRAWRADRERGRRAKQRRLPDDVSELRQLTRVDQVPPVDGAGDDDAGPRASSDFALLVEEQLARGRSPKQIIGEQEARRRYWMAERERISARKESGELVEAAGVLTSKVRLCTAFRRMFLDLCRRAAPLVLGLDDTLKAQRILEAEAEAALTRLQQLGGFPA